MFRNNSIYHHHCWPAVRKAVTAIFLYTLLLSVIESFIVYGITGTVITEPFGKSGNDGILISYCVFSLFNSIILRKYVCVISKKNYRDPRFVCHAFIFAASFSSILLITEMEHNVRMEVHHSKTLSEIKFDENEYYYYIDRAETLDTINGKQEINYDELHLTHATPKHDFRGYYIAPFNSRISVYYAFKYERKYPTNKYSKSESKKIFIQEFHDSVNSVKKYVGNHLFHRISMDNIDYHIFGSMVQYGCSPEKEGYQGIEELLVPVKDDRMPRWYDNLLFYAEVYLFINIFILFIFCTTNTEEPFNWSN